MRPKPGGRKHHEAHERQGERNDPADFARRAGCQNGRGQGNHAKGRQDHLAGRRKDRPDLAAPGRGVLQQTLGKVGDPAPDIDHQRQRHHHKHQDQRQVVEKLGPRVRVGPAGCGFVPKPQDRVRKSDCRFGPVAGIQRRRPQLQQFVRLPFAQRAVDLADQAVRAAIGFVRRNPGGLQRDQLLRKFLPPLRDFLDLGIALGRGRAKRRNLFAQRPDPGRVCVLGIQERRPPFGQLAADIFKPVVGRAPFGNLCLGTFGRLVPVGIAEIRVGKGSFTRRRFDPGDRNCAGALLRPDRTGCRTG